MHWSKFPQLQVGPKSSPFQARVVSVTNQYILSPEDKILLSNAYILWGVIWENKLNGY